MPVKYPIPLNVRVTEEDIRQLDELCRQLDLPRAALIRRAWREWVQSASLSTAHKPFKSTAALISQG